MPGFRWGVDESTDQTMIALMGGPEQFETRHWGAFAQFIPVTDQTLGDGKVIGLVDPWLCKPS